jgi:hypothetical protein
MLTTHRFVCPRAVTKLPIDKPLKLAPVRVLLTPIDNPRILQPEQAGMPVFPVRPSSSQSPLAISFDDRGESAAVDVRDDGPDDTSDAEDRPESPEDDDGVDAHRNEGADDNSDGDDRDESNAAGSENMESPRQGEQQEQAPTSLRLPKKNVRNRQQGSGVKHVVACNVVISPSDVADLEISDADADNIEDDEENIRLAAVHAKKKPQLIDDDDDVELEEEGNYEDQQADGPSLDPAVFCVELRKIARAIVRKSLATIGADLSWDFPDTLLVYGIQEEDKDDPYIMRKREEVDIAPDKIRFIPQPRLAEYQQVIDQIKQEGMAVNIGDKQRLITLNVPNKEGTFQVRVFSQDLAIHEEAFQRACIQLEHACNAVVDEWRKTRQDLTPYEMKKVKLQLFYKTATLFMLALWPRNTFRFAAQLRKFRAPYHVQRLHEVKGKLSLFQFITSPY